MSAAHASLVEEPDPSHAVTYVPADIGAATEAPIRLEAADFPPTLPPGLPRAETDVLLVSRVTQISSSIPLRLDRLPFSGYHIFIVLSLGVSWILDGLIVSSLGLIGSRLQDAAVFGLTPTQVGLVGTVYISGAILGSLFFGVLADKFGRKKLFMITPVIYVLATQGVTWAYSFWLFCLSIFWVGFGVGGEYSAMNSAINELIPAKIRGMVDLAVNGSYWLGALLGAALTIYLLDTKYFAVNIGWRFSFAIGSILGVGVTIMRYFLPESPRWLLLQLRTAEAEELVHNIEQRVVRSTGHALIPVEETITVKLPDPQATWWTVIVSMFTNYKRRSFLAVSLMVAQAFFYNAIFFTYALILNDFYGVPSDDIGYYEMPFCLGNFLGSVLLGPLFDVVGRKPMIAGTYFLSATLLAVTGMLFYAQILTAVTQTVCWAVIFFVSSASSSSAYLTISEIFPLEIRALSIAIFYSIGTGLGGLVGPILFGALVETKDRLHLIAGYFIGSVLMILAAVVELIFGVKAEGKSLEEIQQEEDQAEADSEPDAEEEVFTPSIQSPEAS